MNWQLTRDDIVKQDSGQVFIGEIYASDLWVPKKETSKAVFSEI